VSAKQPQRVVMTWQLPATGGQDPGVGQLILDASINEQHTTTAEVTLHQVETGADITDHIRPIPQRLTIEGIVSNTPIGGVSSYMNGVTGSVQTVSRMVGGKKVSYAAFKFDAFFDRVKAVFGDLANAIQSAGVFTVTTTLATYEDMACTSFVVPRNAQNGNVLRFTMDLQHINFVTTQTVAALPAKIAPRHRGAKSGKEADAATTAKVRQTVAHAILKGLFGVDLGNHN